MTFEINRLMMMAAAKNAAGVVPSHAQSDLLSNILVEGDEDTGEVHMTATNNEVSIQQKLFASVSESGSMLINSRLLTRMLSLLEGDLVTLSANPPNIVNVTGGTCTYSINCMPSKSFPKPVIPFPEESAIITGICSLSKRTSFAVSKEDYRPALQCVQVKLKNSAVHAAACDGTKMMLVKDAAEPTEEMEFLLPGRALSMLASLSDDSDVFEVGDIGKEVVFVRGDMVFSIRKLADSGFIDTAAMIKNIKPAYAATADASKLSEALGIMSISALETGSKNPVNLTLSDGEIALQCRGTYSVSGTSLPANVTKQTPETGFFYEASALLKLFKLLKGRVKLEIDTGGFMLIKTQSEVYCQSAMRAPRDENAAQPKERKKATGAKGADDMNEAA